MARHPELEAAIVVAPSDRDAHRVYADWLQVQGDPLVITGDGMLRLTEVEVQDGEKRIDARKAILSSLRNRLL